MEVILQRLPPAVAKNKRHLLHLAAVWRHFRQVAELEGVAAVIVQLSPDDGGKVGAEVNSVVRIPLSVAVGLGADCVAHGS